MREDPESRLGGEMEDPDAIESVRLEIDDPGPTGFVTIRAGYTVSKEALANDLYSRNKPKPRSRFAVNWDEAIWRIKHAWAAIVHGACDYMDGGW